MASDQIEINENSLPEQSLDEFIEKAYHRYAVLTILDRALPDSRDGLKPVQRRILYAMNDMHINSSGPHRKSARVVGEVLGKYHPHGDQSVYDAMVRLAQDFSMRTPLVDGQGNFGSIDGDSAAAMRYTEARLTEVGESMLADIEKETVDWTPNFDDSLNEPVVLPTRFPNLLTNGSSGIAVGMSTSILPHNLGEVCDGVIFLAKNWKKREKITVDQLIELIPGPDLPTGGILYRFRQNGGDEQIDMIRQAYEEGNATLVCQARADVRDIGNGKSEIVVTELPYQVQKNTILERIASHKEKFPGITDVRDESDFNGMRMVIEVGRNADPNDVLDALFTHTQMRSSLSHNALALVQEMSEDGEGHATPQYLSLKDFLAQFIFHRLDVITRRANFDLKKAEARLHIVEGLLKALSMIDEVVDIIRRSQTTETARNNLMKKLSLTQIQAQAILDMPLRRLASLERKKLMDEEKELNALIKDLKKVLSSESKRLDVVVDETEEIKDNFATPRRTIIIDTKEGHEANITVADLVTPQDSQFVLYTSDTIQRVDAKGYRDSVTFGKPTTRASTIILNKVKAEPTDTILFTTNKGRLWQGNLGRIPETTNYHDFGLTENETIVGCSVAKPEHYLVIITTTGSIKRVKIEDCLNSRMEATWSPIIGLSEEEFDEVLYAEVGTDSAHVMICTGGSEETAPRAIRFEASKINPQATPSAKGVTAIKMLDDALIGAGLLEPENWIAGTAVILTENGYLKQVNLSEFPVKGRGGQGVQIYKVSKASGYVIDFAVTDGKSHIDVYSAKSKRLRLKHSDIPNMGRTANGTDIAKKYGEDGELFSDDRITGFSVVN